jgi:hypothetical protein
LHDDDDDDVAKNQTGNSVVGRVDYVKRERRLAHQFIDIYPSQFQRRLNNDFESHAREDRLKRAMQNARRFGLGNDRSVTADRSRQFAGCFEIWVVGTGAASPRAARITIFTHVFLDSTVSKWCSLNVSDDRCVVVVVVMGLTIREAFQESGGAVVAGTSRSIDRRFASFCHTSLAFVLYWRSSRPNDSF